MNNDDFSRLDKLDYRKFGTLKIYGLVMRHRERPELIDDGSA
jgi:hypothetical protein